MKQYPNRLQVLMSVMNLKNEEQFIKDKNLQTPTIIINQCDHHDYKEIDNIKIYSFQEKGVGLSRNSALMRANAEIVVFADEDIKYVDNYEKIILEEFENNPCADMIVFNVTSENPNRKGVWIEKNHRIHKTNCLKYGAVHFAVRLNRVHEKNIYFSLLFGGGAKYMSGEDSLFIYECLKKGLKVYASKELIGSVKQEESTWFKGYNEKYFNDKAKLYKLLFGRLASFYCLIFLIRHKEKMCKEISLSSAYKIMRKSLKEEI